ncbi:MAG: MATE family efflux transporter, partial [Clostridiales bacterium]|nr:MATE family efflux transporter [Clostridiales bacterium]
MIEKKYLFEEAPVPKAVVTIALPMVMSMLVTIIYNLADTFFVGQTGDPNQVAAVSLTMPVFLVFLALGNMFGIGGGSFISRSLGAKQEERAKNISSFSFYASIVVGVIMIGVFLLGMPIILKFIGASENTSGFSRDYLTYVALGAPFCILSQALTHITRSEGAARQAMVGMMLGTITNIILDPIMILWMGMGVKGAAIATVIGNMAGVVYYILYLTRKTQILSISLKDFKMDDGILTGVLAVGLPASLNSILMSTAHIILNNFLAMYGDLAVAAMGVAMKANMLIILLQIGLAVGIQPLVGYNYVAKNLKRMKSVIKFTAVCIISFASIMTVLYFMGSDFIIRIFIEDEGVIRYGVPMLRAIMIPAPVIGILFIIINSLQAMGKAMSSLILTLSRQGLTFIPAIFILNALFQLDGIIYTQVVADFVSIIVALILFISILKKI